MFKLKERLILVPRRDKQPESNVSENTVTLSPMTRAQRWPSHAYCGQFEIFPGEHTPRPF